MKNILLIGGGGYVGSVVTSYFLNKNYNVSVLDNFIYNHQFAVQSFFGDPRYRIIYGDMSNVNDLKRASKDITDVILMAGLVGDPITKAYPEESETINNIAIKRCINYFNGLGIDKLVFISTCSNYGLVNEDILANEDFKLTPLSFYAKAKVDNERHLLIQKGKVDYTGVILRFATAFGISPRMRFDLSVNEFTRDVFFGKELVIFDENTWRPYCHVKDFARLLDVILNASDQLVNFEVFNAGGDVNNYTKKMILEEIIRQCPSSKVKFSTNGNDMRNYRVSFNKVKSLLGFEPLFTIKDGVAELLNAFGIGLFSDSVQYVEKYGNYKIRQKKSQTNGFSANY